MFAVLSPKDEVAEEAERKGASQIVLDAMRKNKENIDLQDSACRALGSLAMNRKFVE